MSTAKALNTSYDLSQLIVEGMQEKKARDITKIDLRDFPHAASDQYVICHGNSDRQAEAIAKSVEEVVHKITGEWPYHREGYGNNEWILLDYIHVVAHIFIEEKRQFYALEELWADAKIEHYDNID